MSLISARGLASGYEGKALLPPVDLDEIRRLQG